jgi:hypothetical protein
MYPSGVNEIDRERFEARLFLEINSTQMSAKSPLKQAIGVVLISMRLLIEKKKSLSAEELNRSFSGIDDFDFSTYHSSQYKRMAEEIVETYFE